MAAYEPALDTLVPVNSNEYSSNTFVGKFDITAISSRIGRIGLCYPKCLVAIQCGSQCHRTQISSRAKSVEWNKTVNFTTQDVDGQTVTISLYRKAGMTEHLLGQIEERLSDLPKNQELTKPFLNPRKGCPGTITFRMGDSILSDPNSHIFALVIGIDSYKSSKVNNLAGCSNDAKSIKLFFSRELHVPESHMICLCNEAATRDAILSQFRTHLIENPQIKQGDAIIIYYAGHGSRVDAPSGWTSSDGKIETICPHDEWMLDLEGNAIPGIPDRTINELLRRLASEKGNNITVIFDSCHSGGIARTHSSVDQLYPRSLANPCPLRATLDEAIWRVPSRPAHQIVPAGFRYEALSSHVLLAACEEKQVAYETRSPEHGPRGAFTDALVNQLRQVMLDHITYSDLIDSLPDLIHQRPQCEGSNKDSVLFDGKVVNARSKQLFRLRMARGKFEVEAGRIHGVTLGTEFLIQDPNAEWDHLGVLVAEVVLANSSILVHRSEDAEFVVPIGAKARLWDWKNSQSILRVFVNPDSSHLLANSLAGMEAKNSGYSVSTKSFTRVDSPLNAHLSLSLTADGELHIQRLDSLISNRACNPVRFALKNGLDHLPSILDAISQFRYHLERNRSNDLLQPVSEHLEDDTAGMVTLQLYRLKRIEAGFRVPDRDNGDLFRANVARLKAEEGVKYGIEITNHSPHDLFPYLFYFDPSDYSIQAWYLPHSRTMSPPLEGLKRADRDPTKVTVGYGAGGGDPIEFVLNEGQQSDAGFLKLFVSTVYVDMDHVTQSSPFESPSTRKPLRKPEEASIWGSRFATVIVDSSGP